MTLPDAVRERAAVCECCFQGHISCPRCNASGVTGPEQMTCGECKGMGSWPCLGCNGTGYQPCTRCDGTKEVIWQGYGGTIRKPCDACIVDGKPCGFELKP